MCFFDPACFSFAKEVFFRSTPSLLCQGGLHILTKPSLLEGKDVTALRCSEPLRSKVGGASKPSPDFAGWDRLGITGASKPSPYFARWDRLGITGASKPSPYFAGWDRLGTACFFPSPCFAGWDRLGIAGEGKKTVLICEICGTFKGKRICGTIMSERNEIRRNNF